MAKPMAKPMAKAILYICTYCLKTTFLSCFYFVVVAAAGVSSVTVSQAARKLLRIIPEISKHSSLSSLVPPPSSLLKYIDITCTYTDTMGHKKLTISLSLCS